MGWLYMHRAGMGGFDTPKAYLDNQLTWERENEETGSFEGCRVIRSVSTTGAYYAAVQRFGPNNQTHAITTGGIFDYLRAHLPGFRIEVIDHGAGAVSLFAVRGAPKKPLWMPTAA